MREIKFRGKQLDNGEWTYGDLISPNLFNKYPKICFIYDSAPFQEEVDPKTIGQYTGFKDENGKEIYEGDILTREYCETQDDIEDKALRERIIYNSKNAGFYRLNQCGWGAVLSKHMALRSYILGNVHDNFNLVDDKKYWDGVKKSNK